MLNQSHIIVVHQHVSVDTVTFIRVSCNKNTFSVHIIVKICMIKSLDMKFDILQRNLKFKHYKLTFLIAIK